MSTTTLTLTQDCPATTIPDGDLVALNAGDRVYLHQELGRSFTVRTDRGALLQLVPRNVAVQSERTRVVKMALIVIG